MSLLNCRIKLFFGKENCEAKVKDIKTVFKEKKLNKMSVIRQMLEERLKRQKDFSYL